VTVGGPSIDSGGTVQNLDTLIPAGSPYQAQHATAINTNGQIAANATYTPPANPRPAADPGLKPAHTRANPAEHAGMADLRATGDTGPQVSQQRVFGGLEHFLVACWFQRSLACCIA